MQEVRVRPETQPVLLDRIARLLGEATCQHCGQPPFAAAAVSPATTEDVDDDEHWLWRLVEEGERVTAAAPPGPPGDQLTAAGEALTQATATCDRLDDQAAATERALAHPGSWLRPSRRAVLVKQLHRQQAGAVVAAAHRGRAAQRLAELERRDRQRTSYLAEHRDTLAAAANARRELDRRIDDLIHEYGRMADPPPWFRYGLGYPPDPANYAGWLREAREAIAHRRRFGVDHPLEPRG